MIGLTPTLYLSIESKAREFDAKLLVASEVAQRGVDVVIGRQWLLSQNLQFMQPGLVFFKGVNRIQALNMAKAQLFGHGVVANDEEAVDIADQRHMLRDVSTAVSTYCTQIFCHGHPQQQWMADSFPALRGRLSVVGSPRIDLLRPEFRALYDVDAAGVRAKYGRFVLINTNLCAVSSAWGNLEQYAEILVKIGWIDPNNPDDEEVLQEHIEHDTLNMKEIRRLIEILSRSLPDH